MAARREPGPLLPCVLLLAALAGPVHAETPYDPLEPINRPVFVFNDFVDRYALRPIADTYHTVVPAPAQRGVNNFFANLYDVTSAVNSVLQWRWDGALRSSGRVLVNSTLGVVGLFDMATPMGLDRKRTDFGQTLTLWGVPEGPYLMLPLLGPRTFRSGTATLVDTFLLSVPAHIPDDTVRWSLWGTELVNLRANVLEADTLMTGDRYIFVRDAYLQQRAALVNDGALQDSFSNFEDTWEEEF
mgnify:CR=1 FL=1